MNRGKIYTIQLILLLILGSLTHKNAPSQFHLNIFQNDVDTIRSKIVQASEAELPHLYNQLAFHYSFNNADSCFYYSKKALELALERKDVIEEATAYRHMGNGYALLNDYYNAINFLQKALKIVEELDNKRAQLEILTDLGKVNYDANLYDRVMDFNDKAEQVLKEHGDDDPPLGSTFETALLIGLKAISCREARQYDKGIRYFREYLDLYQQVKIPDQAHEIYLASMADIFTRIEAYDSALKYTRMAQSFMRQNKGRSPDQYIGYDFELGNLYLDKGEPDKALPFLLSDLKTQRDKKSYRYAIMTACDIGNIYLEKGNYDSAYFYFQIAFEDSREFRISISQAENAPEVYTGYQYFFNIGTQEIMERYYRVMVTLQASLYNYYKKISDLALAIKHHEELLLYRDSLATTRNNMEVRRMQLAYDTEQIEQENELLQSDNDLKESRLRQNRILIGSISAVTLLIIVIGMVLFRQSRMKSIQDRILIEQRLLRTQMNPHFIFNSLASIQNLIFKKDEMKAGVYLSQFSELVRNILKHSERELIPLEEELTTIRNYLDLQKVRYQDTFDYEIEKDEDIDAEEVEIPPMLAQPFIENAIEHGIKHKQTKGHIWIRYKKEKDGILIEIEDDGIGRARARELETGQKGKHLSMATSITRDRLAALNRKSRNHISLEIKDLKDKAGLATGTLVRFVI